MGKNNKSNKIKNATNNKKSLKKKSSINTTKTITSRSKDIVKTETLNNNTKQVNDKTIIKKNTNDSVKCKAGQISKKVHKNKESYDNDESIVKLTDEEIDIDERIIDQELDNNELESLSDSEFKKEEFIKPRFKFRNKKNTIIFSIFIVVLVCSFAFVFDKFFMPKINLNKGNISIDYQEKYNELGYKAFIGKKNVTRNVQVKGKVNSNKLGVYTITYTINNNHIKWSTTRKVTVKDKSAPTIKLVSNDDIYVCPGDKYKQEEYSAFDKYDGDVSKKVKVSENDNSITYAVVDKAGNKASISRKIIYKDIEKPKIKFESGETIYTFLGDVYSDKGYTAVDNCDGDLTSKVTVSGSVNTAIIGSYTLTYDVSDKANNKTSVTRKVIVSERGKNGTIYLTFDDGPKAGTTNIILDILKEEGIKATFFVTNGGPDELIKREYDEGHSVALHTASHNYAIVYSSVDSYFNDLYFVQNRVKAITGYESKIVRFPGGSSNTISRRYANGIMSLLTHEVLNRGFRYYDWNISSGDAESGGHTSDEIYNNVVKNLSHNKVNMILMHDIKPYTRDALKRIIQYGKSNGYAFESITNDTEMVTQRVNN